MAKKKACRTYCDQYCPKINPENISRTRDGIKPLPMSLFIPFPSHSKIFPCVWQSATIVQFKTQIMEKQNVVQLDFGFELEPATTSIPNLRPKSFIKAKSDFVLDFMDLLQSPIIVYPSQWQDAVPKDLLNNITMARMLTQMRGEHMASLTEVVAYMMPRTFESPMPSEWVNIYTWCGLQYAKTFKKTGQTEAMEEVAPKQLSEYEMGLLKRLRVWIYEKRRQALKDSMKTSMPKLSEPTQNNQGDFF